GGSQIIGERLEPDVGRLIFAAAAFAREGNSPGKTATARGNVLETRVEQRQDLVASRLRLQKLFVRLQQLPDTLGVGAESEKPVLFLDPFQRPCRMQNALAIDDLVV